MGENTKIQWASHTFNPWVGCQKISEGCHNCYAEAINKHYGHDNWGLGKERRITADANWRKPIIWNRNARERGVRERVFCGSMCDVFEDHSTAREQMANVGALISKTPSLDWLLLTKRPLRMSDYMAPYIWDNVWAMTTVECMDRQHRADALFGLACPVRGLSCEPLLGPLDLRGGYLGGDRINWVIVGGETGPGAREMDPGWARDIRDQCRAAGVSFFFKQMSRKAPTPADLQIREFPR